MDQGITSKVITGSTRNALQLASINGVLCLKELLFYETVVSLLNNCLVDTENSKAEELSAILNTIQNKVDYICNIKDRHLGDYREITYNDYNVIQMTNNAPTVSNNSVDANAGNYTFGYADFTLNFSDPENDSPQTLHIVTLPSVGILEYNNVAITASTYIELTDISKLIYVLDNENPTVTSFTFQTSDDNDNKLYSNMATMNIVVDSVVNQPPSFVGLNEFNIGYGVTYTFILDDFVGLDKFATSLMFIDPEGDDLENIKIKTLPLLGILKLDGVAILVNGLVSNAEIVASKLTYTADIATTAAYNETFDFESSDDGSHSFTSGGNFDAIVAAQVNLPPSQIGDGSANVDEGDILIYTRAMFTTLTSPPYADPEGDAAYRLRFDTVPAAGTLKIDGTPLIIGDIVFFTDIDLGKLTYTQAAGAGGTIPTFDFSIADEGSNSFTS